MIFVKTNMPLAKSKEI